MCLWTKHITANTEGYSFFCCGECRALSTSEDGTQPAVCWTSVWNFQVFHTPENSKAHLSSTPEKYVSKSQEFVDFLFSTKYHLDSIEDMIKTTE